MAVAARYRLLLVVFAALICPFNPVKVRVHASSFFVSCGFLKLVQSCCAVAWVCSILSFDKLFHFVMWRVEYCPIEGNSYTGKPNPEG